MTVTYVTLYLPGSSQGMQAVEGGQYHQVLVSMGANSVPSASGEAVRQDPYPQYVDDDELAAALSGVGGGAVDSVNGQTGTVVLDADDIADSSTRKLMTSDERDKLAGVSPGANVYTDEQVRDLIGSTLVAGAGIAKTVDDAANTVTITATGSGGGAAMPGYALMDDFAGATDDDKLTAALTYAAAQTQKPAIMMPVGRMPTFTQTARAMFSGMKLIGPPVVGFQNVEQSGGALNPTRLRVNVGTDASSWFVGSGSVFNVAFRDLSIESTNGNSQFIHHPVASGTMYACNFHNLSFQAFKHVLGSTGTALSCTLCSFTGDWNMTTAKGCQVNVAGSDNVNLWCGGSLNVGPAGNGSVLGAGEYLVKINTAKSNWGNVYITADDQFRALKLEGTASFQVGNRIRGFVIEGRNTSDPSVGALVRCSGGGWDMDGFDLNYAMSSPSTYTDATDRGYIHQTGGVLHMSGITVDRAAGVGETVPIVFVSAGEAIVKRVTRCAKGGAWTVRPTVQQTTSGLIIDNDATVQLVTAA